MRIRKGNPLSGSVAEVVANYDKLATDFLTFFPELIVHMEPHPCRHVDPTGMRGGWRGARAYSRTEASPAMKMPGAANAGRAPRGGKKKEEG